MVEFVKLYSYSVDFQREIRKGDSFEIYYSEFATKTASGVKSGDILFASLQTGKKPMSLWRFEIPGEDTVDYFDENGQSSKKFLMRTPVDGARISSSFGHAPHPDPRLLQDAYGYRLRSPHRTPIYAPQWHRSQGGLERRAMASTSRFATPTATQRPTPISAASARASRGRPRQAGPDIGRVGSTGRSQARPALRSAREGKKVNPMTIPRPDGPQARRQGALRIKAARDGHDC